jgi:hypothetical protein
MQTFLPYADFKLSAEVLDNRRLGKQRVEAYQILLTITENRKGWSNHPATKMWAGYESSLCVYMNCMIMEWIRRGFKNTMSLKSVGTYIYPPWFGNELFHSSHRAALLAKAPAWYSKFNWSEKPIINYVWPTKL